ncbi:MAG TPA: beta-N-acetylhexosaminidase [Kofleriaceae bacterium]|nr:beta-N-acetylhexosaminidase [Kofleriaceae bacterium]
MTALEDDVGQLLWIGFEGSVVTPELAARLGRGEAGAVVLFKRNLRTQVVGSGSATAVAQEVTDVDALVELNRALHAAREDLLICVDQEGGTVQRVRAPATQWPPMLAFDQIGADDEAFAEEVGHALGAELAAMGFDVDFAPVLDVHTNEANPIIGERAFGRDAASVARRGLAFARGLARAGVLACGKHFPGHGDTVTDSHLALPRIDHDMARLEQVELVPFARAAQARVPMIMTAHVVFAAIDPSVPATLSHAAITGILRDKLGYRGVIVSDDLDMKAIADHFGVGEAAVSAITAGCDALLLCREPLHQRQAREALLRAGTDQPAVRARIAESAARIRDMKRAHVSSTRSRDVVGSVDHRRLADRLAGRA